MQGRLVNFSLCEYIDTALGKLQPDLIITGASMVNMNTREVYRSDIVVKKERIVFVGEYPNRTTNKTSVIKADGLYAVPGFIDAHIHVESSMLTITEFSRLVTQHGTTSIIWDPHELVNVVGLDGLRLAIKEAKRLPLHTFFVIPSCVPSSPGKETAGANLSAIKISSALKQPMVIGLGEMMDFRGVLSCSDRTIDELELAKKKHMLIDGHAPGLRGRELCAYIDSGIWSDHESENEEEGLEKLRLGMWLMVRESSTSKDLSNLIKPIVRGTIDARHCMLVSDDRSVNDLLSEGHVDHILRRAISEGLDPITALQLVTINPASYMHMENEIGSISPGRVADIVLLNDLRKVDIKRVIIRGKELSNISSETKFRYPAKLTSTINIRREPTPSDFLITPKNKKGEADVRVIKLNEDQLLTSEEIRRLEVEDRSIKVAGDVLHAAVIERHHRTGNIGKGFITGLGPLNGAIAQTIAHDSHNLIVVGSNPMDMSAAARAIASIHGGVALSSDQKTVALLKLEIAGLISADIARDIAGRKEFLENQAKKLGVEANSPITTLSFLSLPVIPQLRLTDQGLFDVNKDSFIDPIARQ
jgi:adenine deaminase